MPIGPFRTSVWSLNVRDLARFDAGTEVTPELLKEKGLVRNLNRDIKVLGYGDLAVKLSVSAHSFSKSAVEKIEAAGGSVTWLKPPHVPKKRRHKKAKPSESARRDRGRRGDDRASRRGRACRGGSQPAPRNRQRARRCSPGSPTPGGCRSSGAACSSRP